MYTANMVTTDLRLRSSAFAGGRKMPKKYTCQGQDISPPLSIAGTPMGAKSLALIMHDPDAPAGDWVHWTVWNLPANTSVIPEASLPVGAVEGMTSFGTTGYGGPCPPSNTHHYVFELYALDSEFDLSPVTTANGLHVAMFGHILATATLTGIFSH